MFTEVYISFSFALVLKSPLLTDVIYTDICVANTCLLTWVSKSQENGCKIWIWEELLEDYIILHVNQAVSQLQDAFSNALLNEKKHPDPAAKSRCKPEGEAF